MSQAPILCVYCRTQPAVAAFHPFCSERCKMADLAGWLNGNYRVSEDSPDSLDSHDSHDSYESGESGESGEYQED
jgi:endogenous inhibitor of DNA gyrase (YacG/DUF329 family)